MLLGACTPRGFVIDKVAAQLAAQGGADEEDLGLAREASAFYLKLSESVLAEDSGNVPLAEAVSAGFTRYAFAFIASEAERMEVVDSRSAFRLKARAVRMYKRAQGHALGALTYRHPRIAQSLAEGERHSVPRLRQEEIGLAYWAAAAWGARIALIPDDAAALAELPQAATLAAWAWTQQPNWGQGALAALMGRFELVRPGGSPVTARRYFDQAVAFSGERSAAPFVAMAESIALPAADRAAFEALLRRALAVAESHTTLENEVFAARARWLLEGIEDRF